MGVVDERRVRLLDLAAAFDVQLVVAVDHHLGHRGVQQKRLEGTVAEDVGGDLALEFGAVARAEG